MKFYNSVGPNPRVVKIFMAEKGLNLPEVTVDLRSGENRRAPYNESINPTGQTPALEMQNGEILTEITAICEYLDEIGDGPSLIGDTPEERAATRMWTRRVDLNICEPLTNGFRFAEGLAMFESRIRVLPEAAAGLKATAQDGVAWVNKHMGDGPFLCGDRLSLADIMLFTFLEFGNQVGQPVDPAHDRISAWFEQMKSRPAMQQSQ